MTDNELRRTTNGADGRSALVTTAGLLLMAVAALHILYGIFMSMLVGVGGEDAPFKKLSVLIGIFEAIIAAGILKRREWARALGLTLAALGIGLALIGIFVHGLTVARDEGSGYLMLGFLGSYSFIVVVLATKGLSFRKGDLTW